MPYIKRLDRLSLDKPFRSPANAGEFNYKLHLLISNYVDTLGESYQTYNDIVGVLECAKMELYRRRVSKYEDQKINENGDIKFYE